MCEVELSTQEYIGMEWPCAYGPRMPTRLFSLDGRAKLRDAGGFARWMSCCIVGWSVRTPSVSSGLLVIR